MFKDGRYKYMDEIQAIDECRPSIPSIPPEKFSRVSTSLRAEEWEIRLRSLPDRRCANFLIKGISEGFRLGFQHHDHQCSSAKDNMRSAAQNPRVVEGYLEKEVAAGRIVGPVPLELVKRVQISRFGVIPKSQPGKWRLILDLSHPDGRSVNDGIDQDLCSLTYSSVDQAAQCVVALGRGAQLAKLDLESAYRMIPIHPDDRHLLGMRWKNKVWIDTALPFGLRSAPKVFNVMADCLHWFF